MPVPRDPLDLGRSALRDDVYTVLERRLVSGELAPGAPLNDADLLALTGTSRAPLREALNNLAAVGLVAVYPRRATVVTALDGRATRESIEIEGALVGQALLEVVPHLDASDRAALTAAHQEVVATPDAFRVAAQDRSLRRLLQLVLDRTDNAEYVRVDAAVSPVVDRHVSLCADRFAAGHRARFDAVLTAALDADERAAATAWGAFVAALHADPALDSTPADSPGGTSQTTLRDKAAAAIEAAVLDGTLLPGETLSESELMVWLGISRTPVREALTALHRKGLVTQRHHRSARVATQDDDGLRDLLRALGVLRRLSVRLAMERDLEAVTAALGATLPAWEGARDPEALTVASGRTLDVFADLCGNRLLVELIGTMAARGRWSALHSAAVLELPAAANTRALYDAVAAGRTEDAEAALWRSYAQVTD